MTDYKFVSADSHVQESDELYQRVPSEYRSRLPHLEVIDGKRYSVAEGHESRRLDIAEAQFSERDHILNFGQDPSVEPT